MKLNEIYNHLDKCSNLEKKYPVISFEFFPPKDDLDGEKTQKLFGEINILKKYNPSLVSLTIGAGGYNQDLAVKLLIKIKNELNISVMPHFTCICTTAETAEKKLSLLKDIGVENILALRGDEPQNIDNCLRDFHYANELVTFIKERSDFSLAVAGYPEGHIESSDIHTDIENLKRKVDAGAVVIYTQLFFDNRKFFNYIQLVREAGINIPIVAGIMPVISLKQVEKITTMMKVDFPKTLRNSLEKSAENPEDIKKIGIDFASAQCRELIDAGVAGLHFYTLNKSYSVSKILDNIY